MLVGILGFGSIGQRHGRNLMDLGHQVMFHDPDVLGSVDRNWLISGADAMIICTPTVQHARDLADVLQAKKHVLVEKPIGYDSPPFIAGLIHGARLVRKDLVVATGFMCRFHPEVQRAKIALARGYYGKIKEVSFAVLQRNNKPEYLRDGVIRNWASHEIDIARYLLGNMHLVNCVTKLSNGQDIQATITMESVEGDFPVYVQADYTTNPEIRKFLITGSKIKADFNLNPDIIAAYNRNVWDQTYKDELCAFFNAIDGKDAGPLADGVDGVAALQIVMDARTKAGLE